MAHESNHWANVGAKNSGASEADLRRAGASGDQAAEARAAQERQRIAAQQKTS